MSLPFATFGVRRLLRRDPDQTHRAATPLELLFDLVSVIAIAAAAAGLHHAIAEAHAGSGVIQFGCAFFGIWWAWMNFTWYASAYDNDDTLHRLLTMVVMSGALCMAAGIDAFFTLLDLRLLVIGYVIMRIAMVALWLRAARHDAVGRGTALRYGVGIAVAQVYWIAFLVSQPLAAAAFYTVFVVGVAIELAVPVIAESRSATPWHRHHIVERYGLLNIIVLGETLLAASFALQRALGEQFTLELVRVACNALVILFAMWWLYFCREQHLQSRRLAHALIWGYGHVLIFAAGAAIGAGVAALVDIHAGHASASLTAGHAAVAVPVAAYILGLWLVRDRYLLRGASSAIPPLLAGLILLAPLVALALESIALLSVLCVVVRNRLAAAAA